MSFKTYFLILIFIVTAFNCKQKQIEIASPQIIPIPKIQKTTKGQFVLNSNSGIEYDKAFNISANFLKF